MSDTPYQPIACSDYDTYEIAIMQGRELQLILHDKSGTKIRQRVKPLKLQIRDKAEYLQYIDQQHQPSEIRLDRILLAEIINE